MLSANQSGRVWLILLLPVLALPAGCGFSLLPLSLSGSSGPAKTSINLSPPVYERTESEDSFEDSSSEPLSVATNLDVTSSPTEETPPVARPSSAAFDSKQLVGCWRDGFCGQRTLTLKADGSATMLLELDFAGRLLYGKTLEFDMRWSLSESILSLEILTGRPVDAARSAIKLWGEAFEYRIELVDHERLHGWTSDDATLYKLRRITPPDAADSEQRQGTELR